MVATVADLIENLKKCPPYAEIAIYANGMDYEIDHLTIEQTHDDIIVWIDAFAQ